jgi:hypothetical protein
VSEPQGSFFTFAQVGDIEVARIPQARQQDKAGDCAPCRTHWRWKHDRPPTCPLCGAALSVPTPGMGWRIVDIADPPSGPRRELPTKAEGQFSAYVRWRGTEDGHRAWRWIVEQALLAAERRQRRVSPRTLVARCRDTLHVKLNDHYSAWIGDDLWAAFPILRPLIERRRRWKVKA